MMTRATPGSLKLVHHKLKEHCQPTERLNDGIRGANHLDKVSIILVEFSNELN
jgi:hypothetical protein